MNPVIQDMLDPIDMKNGAQPVALLERQMNKGLNKSVLIRIVRPLNSLPRTIDRGRKDTRGHKMPLARSAVQVIAGGIEEIGTNPIRLFQKFGASRIAS
jgi:hypothetical protein